MPTFMREKLHTIRQLAFWLAPVLLVWIACGQASAQRPGGLTPQEKRGKQIYTKGEGGSAGDIIAVLGTSDLELPATSFSCFNCHGIRGEGTREGGLQPPPINWDILSSRQSSTLTSRPRRPYTDLTLARAISIGVDSEGGRLHPGMPQYKMKPEQMADLIAYLRKLGKESDTDPGLTDDAILIGAALPVSGQLATVGASIKAALSAYLDEVNAQGGVYGRKFQLIVEDSRGDAAGTEEATRRLVERHEVFALAASFEPAGSRSTNEYLERKEVPLIGPVTLSPRLPPVPNRYVFYLLPGFEEQSRSLVEFLRVRGKGGKAPLKISAFASEDEFGQDALSGLRSHMKAHSMGIVAEHTYKAGQFSAAAAAGQLAGERPDYIFFFGRGEEFARLGQEIDRVKLESGLMSSSLMVGREAFSLPASVAARTFLAFPSSLPSQDEFAEFLSVMQRGGVSLSSPAFQAIAFAAGKILVEASRSSSRQLDRHRLIASVEKLNNYRTGVLPPMTFGPNRRIGAGGSFVVGIDLANRQYVPLGERLIPKSR